MLHVAKKKKKKNLHNIFTKEMIPNYEIEEKTPQQQNCIRKETS
jgi:hypothetical protein